jgi:hypothetical protein
MTATAGGQSAGGSEAVGTVSVLYGSVKAVSADGMVRTLSVNSSVFAYDRIVTDDDGSVSIALGKDPAAYVEIDRASDVLIDEDVFGEATTVDVAAATAGFEDVRELLLAGGDPASNQTPADAAGDDGAAIASAGTIPDFLDEYRLVSDDAGKAKLVFYDGDHHEVGSVTFDGIDYDPGLDVNLLLGQIDGDEDTGA